MGRVTMNYGDFSSVVQLGVGLHLGTALLQLYGELGVQPLVRTIDRTRRLFILPEDERPPKYIEDELDGLESRFEIFKIQLFQEYRKYVAINSAVALILVVILTILAFKATDPITEWWDWVAVLMVAISILPAPVTLGALWFDAEQRMKPMKAEADSLERRALSIK
jgi:hypothetical protein